jgi:hypothetical protein
VSGGKEREDLRDPHRRQMGVVRRLRSSDVEGRRRRCVELGGRAIRVRMERGPGPLCGDGALGWLLWAGERPKVGGRGVTGGGSVELQWRSRFG